MFYIYIHIRNDSSQPFYIGKGFGDRSHSKKSRNIYWNNIVNKYGYTIMILKDNLTEQEAFDLEIKIIKKYRKLYKLCNMTSGGEGTTSHKHSQKSVLKMSKFRKSHIGWSHSEKTKEKISKAHKSRVFTEQHKINIGKTSIGRTHSEETKKRLRSKTGTTVIQYDLEDNRIKSWATIKGAARELKINSRGIRACLSGKNKTSGGFIWREN